MTIPPISPAIMVHWASPPMPEPEGGNCIGVLYEDGIKMAMGDRKANRVVKVSVSRKS